MKLRPSLRPRSPAPDGPGDHDHDLHVIELRGPAGPEGSGYFDGGLGRAGFEPEERCLVDELCALTRDHGGGCDPRPEPERARALDRLLDRELEDDALTAAVEREGADALRLARS